MHPYMEADFRNQQSLLLRLIAERIELGDGTPAAEEVDQRIAQAKALVHSYQAIKWSELEGQRPLGRRKDAGSSNIGQRRPGVDR
jgi:hypothetical protein